MLVTVLCAPQFNYYLIDFSCISIFCSSDQSGSSTEHCLFFFFPRFPRGIYLESNICLRGFPSFFFNPSGMHRSCSLSVACQLNTKIWKLWWWTLQWCYGTRIKIMCWLWKVINKRLASFANCFSLVCIKILHNLHLLAFYCSTGTGGRKMKTIIVSSMDTSK